MLPITFTVAADQYRSKSLPAHWQSLFCFNKIAEVTRHQPRSDVIWYLFFSSLLGQHSQQHYIPASNISSIAEATDLLPAQA